MKLAYVITHPAYRVDGVTQKVRYQTEAWKRAGHEVRIFLVTDAVPEGDPPFEAELFLRRRQDGGRDRLIEKKAYAALATAIRDFAPDAVYLRWQYHRKEVTALKTFLLTTPPLRSHRCGAIPWEADCHSLTECPEAKRILIYN